jgi:hypothetical protein
LISKVFSFSNASLFFRFVSEMRHFCLVLGYLRHICLTNFGMMSHFKKQYNLKLEQWETILRLNSF